MDTLTQSDPERLPLDAVMSYADRFVTAWYGGHAPPMPDSYLTPDDVKAQHPEWGKTNAPLPVLLLAEKAGLNPTTLNGWLRVYRQGGGTMSFWDADRILTALNRVGAWQSDPVLAALRAVAEESAATLSEHEREDSE